MVAARKLVIILDGGGGRLAVHAGRGVLTESVQLAMTLHYQLHGALPACLPACLQCLLLLLAETPAI